MGSESVDLKQAIADMAQDLAPKGDEYEMGLLSDDDVLCDVTHWLHSGSLALDLAMGHGYPCGRAIEIFGDNSTGKSLLGTEAIIEAQRQKWVTELIDNESATSRPLMEQLGVDTEALLYSTPDTVEQVRKVVEESIAVKSIRLGKDHPMLIVWDSVAASTTQTEMDVVEADGLDKQQFAKGAAQISAWLRTGLIRTLARNSVCLILVNQIRENVGVMFGPDHTTYGGKAIPFYASIRLELKVTAKIKEAGAPKSADPIGVMTKVTAVKNKVAPPFRSAKLPIYFGYGFDDAEAVYELMRDRKMMEVVGGWNNLTLGGEKRKWQGPKQFVEDDGLFDTHYNEIRDLLTVEYSKAGLRPEAVEHEDVSGD
jgi:recombination protein RecA